MEEEMPPSFWRVLYPGMVETFAEMRGTTVLKVSIALSLMHADYPHLTAEEVLATYLKFNINDMREI